VDLGQACWNRRFVRFEDIEAFEFLVYNCQWLELLCLDNLFVEPILDFVLLYFGQFLVIVVEMSIELQ
jgi:hypothetical protein